MQAPWEQKWIRLLAMVAAVVAVGAGLSADGAEISNETVRVRSIGKAGAFTGFRITPRATDAPAFEISLSTAGHMHAGKVETAKAGAVRSIRLSGIRSTPTPPVNSGEVTLSLLGNDPYPLVSFRLDLDRFDAKAWVESHGEVPFHFLSCSLPGAEVFHQRGWPIGTPDYDPYPMRLAEGPGRTVVSHFSNNWANIPPIGGYPFPVVGLWNPSRRRYIAYDFHGSRLTDHSEKFIASTYCYAHKGRKVEAFTLAYPYGGPGYQQLAFPEKPARLESWFRVLYSGRISGEEDPNLFVTQWLWRTYSDMLPQAPAVNDMGWLPRQMRYETFPAPGIGRLYGPEAKPRWFEPGTVRSHGLGDNIYGVDYAYATGDSAAVQRLREQVEWLRQRARRFKIGQDECVFWEKPISGEGAKMFGPGVNTIHSVGGWGIALALLELYRNEPNKASHLLPDIDGALRFTRHILYTRNCYPDVPAAQFAWSASPAAAFCLRYYYTFRTDPKRAGLAALAYKLSRTITYRYLAIWTSDNDDADGDDASFFMEPNAGAPWCACACANEIWVLPKPLIRVYVATGDPVLAYYVRGMLARFNELAQDVIMPSLPEYRPSFYSERFGLFPGCPQGDGVRGDFGGLWGGAEELCWPPGEAMVRVVCGERAAIAFNKNGVHTDIADYRVGKNGDCSFRLVAAGAGRPAGAPGAVCVTFPFFKLKGKKVVQVHQGGRKERLVAGHTLSEYGTRPDTITVRDVRHGDSVIIGDGALQPVPMTKLRPRTAPPPVLAGGGFKPVRLDAVANAPVDVAWGANEGYGGLWPGLRWVAGVPFLIVDPVVNKGMGAVKGKRVDVGRRGRGRPASVFALVSGHEGKGLLRVRYADGSSSDVSTADAVPFLVGWPRCFTWSLDLLSVPTGGRAVASVEPADATLFALTLSDKTVAQLPATAETLEERIALLRSEREAVDRLAKLAPLLEEFSGHIGILPGPGKFAVHRLRLYRSLMRAGLHQHLRLISPADMVNPAVFNRDNYPVVLYLHSEEYIEAVNEPGDAVQALRGYLADGGVLLVLPGGPFPFYYPCKPNGNRVEEVANGSAAGRVGLPICGSGYEGRQDFEPDAPFRGWEQPPEGVKLTFHLNPDQKHLRSLPETFEWMEDADQRWRPVNRISKDIADGVPLMTLKDAGGRSYGDGAAWIHYKAGELAGGTVVYAWASLLKDPTLGPPISAELLESVLQYARPQVIRLPCLRLRGRIDVDGKLDEAAWADAPSMASFTCLGLRTGQPPFKTSARVLWDENGLYVGFKCEDPDVFAQKRGHDGFLWEDEVVEVYIDPDGDGKDYYEFEISPRGETIDLKIPSPESLKKGLEQVRENAQWEAEGWKAAVHVDGTLDDRKDTDRSWTAETFIPWSAMPEVKRPGIGTSVRFQLYRIERAAQLGDKPMYAALARTPTFHSPEHFARLTLGGNPFDEDFAEYPAGAAPAPQWQVRSGTWSVKGGVLVGENADAGSYFPLGLHSRGGTLTDFTLSVKFRIAARGEDHRDGCWIGFRDCGDDAGYSVHFMGSGIRLMKRNKGRTCNDGTQLATCDWTADDAWHVAEITAVGRRLKIRLDGETIFDVSDDDFLGVPWIKSGGIVLCARRWSGYPGSTRAEFRSVKVSETPR